MYNKEYSVIVLPTTQLLSLQLLDKTDWAYVGDWTSLSDEDIAFEANSIKDIFRGSHE